MLVEKLENKVPKRIHDLIKSQIKEFTPPQEQALLKGLFKGNMVVSSPTASGKTLIAEMAFLKTILESKKKAVYIVPLRSLAFEKHAEFKEKYGKKIRVMISTGDLDSSDEGLGKADLIITTSEKMDSLIRHGAPWINRLGLLVIDEIHLLGDSSRGATLEVLITRLRNLLPKTMILGLSATIKNAREISEWLGAELVESDYRPVKLYEGILLNNIILFGKDRKTIITTYGEASYNLIKDACQKGKQCLVFVSSRRRAESLASKLKLTSNEELKNASKQVLKALSRPTTQCRKLSDCFLNGTAFHHAGLLQKQKTLVEESFRQGQLPVIFATPTLAMGVDLPAFRVVVRDLKRYSQGYSDWISVMEYKQLAGRAGRPKYSEYGEAVTIASSEDAQKEIEERFINGEVEEVYSQLSVEPNLRAHLLSLIAQAVIREEKDVNNFFEQTFYAHQYKDLSDMDAKIRRVLDQLETWGFVKYKDNVILPTKYGIRVSQLYLDPRSACTLMMAVKNSLYKEISEVGLLHACNMTSEAKPLLRLNRDDYVELAEGFMHDREKLLLPEPPPDSYEAHSFMRAYKTACMLEYWIDERTEQQILDDFKVSPGDIRSRNLNMDWLLYSTKELALLMGAKHFVTPVNNLRVRVKHGVKKELLPLIRYKGIGRVRARTLFVSGIKTTKELRKASFEVLERLLGEKTAVKLKEQVQNKAVRPNSLYNYPREK
jgi:helicase